MIVIHFLLFIYSEGVFISFSDFNFPVKDILLCLELETVCDKNCLANFHLEADNNPYHFGKSS